MTRKSALAVALIVAGCTESSRPPRPPTSPGTFTPPTVTSRLELSGPDTVPLGQTVQFTATAHLSDGTTRDVTREVAWRNFNPGVLTMSEPGLFTGRANGQTPVSAALGGITTTIGEVIVVPGGTFRLIGVVRDSGVPVDAVVSVENSSLGRVSRPTAGGQYVVYGVAGETEVEVEKPGYQEERTIRAIVAHTKIDFDLRLLQPRDTVEGQYRLTVTAGPECGALPAEAQSRSYGARLEQSGPNLTVILEGAQFGTTSGRTLNRFTGFLEPDRAVFALAPSTSYYYYYYFYFPDVLEALGGGRHYSFEGRVVAGIEPDGFAGTIDGAITLFTGPPYRFSHRCRSRAHRFVLTRVTT